MRVARLGIVLSVGVKSFIQVNPKSLFKLSFKLTLEYSSHINNYILTC